MHIILPAEPRHIEALATRLRDGDAAELQCAGLLPTRALWRSWRGSLISRVALVDGEIAAAWGMGGSPFGRIGRPWLLTAPPVERAKIAFLRESRHEVALMLAVCPELRGVVDAAYGRAVRFLGALGFTLGPEFPYGPHEAPFREYRISRG